MVLLSVRPRGVGKRAGLGIGQGLLDEARRVLGPRVSLILVSVPEAVGFYQRVGMTDLPRAFWYKRTE